MTTRTESLSGSGDTRAAWPARRSLPGLLLMLVLPFAAGAGPDDAAALARNRQRIEQMSAAERARLDYFYRAWSTLSEAEREKYRRLHDDLQSDAATGGRLRDELQRYEEWLGTLSEWQRDQLRGAPDAAARMLLVRQFREEQSDEQTGRRGGRRAFESRAPVPDPEEVAAQTAALMGAIENRLSENVRNELMRLPPAQRYTRVLALALRPHLDQRQPGPLQWPDEALVERMITALPTDNSLRQWLQETRNLEQRRWRLRMSIGHGVRTEWLQLAEDQAPSDERLQRLVSEMGHEQQVVFTRLSRDDARRRLVWEHFEQNPPAGMAEDLESWERLRRVLFFGPREPFRGGGRPRPRTDEGGRPRTEEGPRPRRGGDER